VARGPRAGRTLSSEARPSSGACGGPETRRQAPLGQPRSGSDLGSDATNVTPNRWGEPGRRAKDVGVSRPLGFVKPQSATHWWWSRSDSPPRYSPACRLRETAAYTAADKLLAFGDVGRVAQGAGSVALRDVVEPPEDPHWPGSTVTS